MSDPRPTPPVVTAKDEEQALKLAGPIVAGLVAPPRDEEAHCYCVQIVTNFLKPALAAARAEGFEAGQTLQHAHCLADEVAKARAEAAAEERERAALTAQTWRSSTFPQGEPVDHATHEQICADICWAIAEEIRRG